MDSGIVVKMDKDFVQKHTLFTLDRIYQLENIEDRVGQPPYIQMMHVNNQTVAFIGNRDIDEEKLSNLFLRVDKMVIPEFAQLVDPDVLANELATLNDEKAVEVSRRGLLVGDKLSTSILLDVCGMIHTSTHKDMHFHNCKNKKPDHSLPLDWSPWGFGTCPFPVLTHYFDGAGDLKHNLMMFYISRKDLESTGKADSGCYPLGIDHDDNSLLNILGVYFQDHHLTMESNPSIDWHDSSVLQGVFLIPVLLADQRVAYYCLPNVNGRLNNNHPSKTSLTTKSTLNNWLHAVEEYNCDVDNQIMAVEGDDGMFLFLERLSIFFTRNAIPHVAPKKDVLLDLVHKNRVS